MRLNRGVGVLVIGLAVGVAVLGVVGCGSSSGGSDAGGGTGGSGTGKGGTTGSAGAGQGGATGSGGARGMSTSGATQTKRIEAVTTAERQFAVGGQQPGLLRVDHPDQLPDDRIGVRDLCERHVVQRSPARVVRAAAQLFLIDRFIAR